VRITDSTLNVNGTLTISAHDVTTVVSTVDAISLAIGIFSLAAGGASATSNIGSTVSADVSGSNVTAGAVVIEAVATPKARSEAKGVNAGVMVPVTAKSSPFKGSATLTSEQAKAFAEGNVYFNVHTEQNKGGEIRGQMTPEK